MPPVLPVNVPEVLLTVFGGIAVLIPIIGITARFALRPIAEAIAHMREMQGQQNAEALLERRVALVEQELQHLSALRADVQRLLDEKEFERRLLSPASPTRGA